MLEEEDAGSFILKMPLKDRGLIQKPLKTKSPKAHARILEFQMKTEKRTRDNMQKDPNKSRVSRKKQSGEIEGCLKDRLSQA